MDHSERNSPRYLSSPDKKQLSNLDELSQKRPMSSSRRAGNKSFIYGDRPVLPHIKKDQPFVLKTLIIPMNNTAFHVEFNVILEGLKVDKRSRPEPTPRVVKREEHQMPEDFLENFELPYKPPFKAAILPQTGTLSKVDFTPRPKPKPKRATKLHQKDSTRTQTAFSLRSVPLDIADSEDVVTNSAVDGKASQISTHSYKSTKDLVEEARRMAESGPKLKKSASSKRASSMKGTKAAKTKSASTEDAPDQMQTAGGDTVEDIILRLKQQAKYGLESESDKKIKEIMINVVKRTKEVLGETAITLEEGLFSDHEEQEEEPEPTVSSEQKEGTETVTEEESVPPVIQEALENLQKAAKDELTVPEVEIDKAESSRLSEDFSFQPTEAGRITSASSKTTEKSILDIEELKKTANLNLNVTKEDMISASGFKKKLHADKRPIKTVKEVKVKSEEEKIPNVHYFCTLTQDIQMSDPARNVWKKYHVPSKFAATQALTELFDEPRHGQIVDSIENPIGSGGESLFEKQSQAAERIMNEAYRIARTASKHNDLDQLKLQAAELLEPLTIIGDKVELKTDLSFFYWEPAPPKWSVQPNIVKGVMCPLYESAAGLAEWQIKHAEMLAAESEESDLEDYNAEEEKEREAADFRIKLTINKANSLTDLTSIVTKAKEEDEKKKHVEEIESEHKSTSGEDETTLISRPSDSHPKPPVTLRFGEEIQPIEKRTVTKAYSCPNFTNHIEEDDVPIIFQDYGTVIEEIKNQKTQLEDRRKNVTEKVDEEDEVDTTVKISSEIEYFTDSDKKELTQVSLKKSASDSNIRQTLAEEALEAGRSYVLLPPQPKRKKKNAKDWKRIEDMEKLFMTTRLPERCSSLPLLPFGRKQLEIQLRVPQRIRSRNQGSEPDIFNFESYKQKHNFKPNNVSSEREWVRSIWNDWFDYVFPPTPVASESEEDDDNFSDYQSDLGDKPEKEKEEKSVVYDDDIVLEPICKDNEDREVMEALTAEVVRLSEKIDSEEQANAYDYCRRGAILRKLGNIRQALWNLNKAIRLEPTLLDAYWHRHFIYLLQNKLKLASEDLNFILKVNKKHAEAFRSRAEISKADGDLTMAIVNYTQAIKINPTDHESFYQRGLMYEKKGDILLAMEDYANVSRLNPKRTIAMFKRAMHHFKNENWANAVNEFSELLRHDNRNADAYLYRGRAHGNMSDWSDAIFDLTTCIHLNPKCAQAFYYRGCLLRRCHPKQALLDFSVSLMIDDSHENILSYLHRGILYDEIGRHEDAIMDFEAVVKLDRDMACAHVNLGLIYLNRMGNPHRAIKKLTAAIKADPTYIKAYVCRAEAYTRLNQHKQALLDFTRAIHIRPDVHNFYLFRGELVRKLGNLQLASFCVKQAAELNIGLGTMPTQQAIVQSFLKNYDQAIECLETACKANPQVELLQLLGKTQMKAQKWSDACTSFQKALDLLRPWKDSESWPIEASEIHFLMGQCCMEDRKFLNAQQSFDLAIQSKPNYAEAYYQRGLAKIHNKERAINDFNKALAISPNLFEAYLCRACYYGMKNNYKKAILNCNEALKIQPKSVRALLYRGALKYHIKAYKLAIFDLTIAINYLPTSAIIYFNRALCYDASGYYQEALRDYSIVLTLGDKLEMQVLTNRALVYMKLNDHNNAVNDLFLVEKITPSDVAILFTIGICLHRLRKLEEAVKYFTRVLSYRKLDLNALVARGNVFLDYGNELGLLYAKRDYARAISLKADYIPARINLAYALQVYGHYQRAWHQFTACIEIDSKCQRAYEGRSIINLQMSDFFAAFQDINAAIRCHPTAELYNNRGVIFELTRDGQNAMANYKKAIEIDSSYSLSYYNAANIYMRQKQYSQALTYLDNALKWDPSSESAYLNRAIVKVFLKDMKSALKDMNQAVRLAPRAAINYLNRANINRSIGKLIEAERDYSKALHLQPDDPLVHKRRADTRAMLNRKDSAMEDYKRAIDLETKNLVRISV